MGMFDHVRCEYPLPDGFVPGDTVVFQTKDMDNVMDNYRISAEGRLLCEKWSLAEAEAEDPAASSGLFAGAIFLVGRAGGTATTSLAGSLSAAGLSSSAGNASSKDRTRI